MTLPSLKLPLVGLFTIIIAVGFYRGSQEAKQVNVVAPSLPPCRVVSPGYYDCTDQELINRLNAQRPLKEIKPEPRYVVKATFTAYNTAYSRLDSCHNKRGNECLTAIGRDTKEGTTVACPRNLKLGTLVRLNGHIYTCEDRYSLWVDDERPLPTIDIFTENYLVAKNWKSKNVKVEVVEQVM